MRTFKAGFALALVVSPARPAVRGRTPGRRHQRLGGGRSKKPYGSYIIRARDVSTNTVAERTTLERTPMSMA